MKLPEKDKQIIAGVELAANISMPRLKKITGYREHSLRYKLQRFIDTGLLDYKPLINLRPCGFREYEVFFSMPETLQAMRAKVLDELSAVPEVISVQEYAGDYDCSLTIAAKDIEQLSKQFEQLSARFGSLFSSKSISTRVSTSIFNRKYLWEKANAELRIPAEHTEQANSLDELDIGILKELTTNGQRSSRLLARALSMPIATLHFRLKRLEHRGVIVGYRYSLNTSKIGVQCYKLLLSAKQLTRTSRLKLRHYCKEQSHVVEFIHCMGSWDYELNVEVENAEELAEFRRTLHERFSQEIASVHLVGILNRSGRNYGKFFSSLKDNTRGESCSSPLPRLAALAA